MVIELCIRRVFFARHRVVRYYSTNLDIFLCSWFLFALVFVDITVYSRRKSVVIFAIRRLGVLGYLFVYRGFLA